MCDNHNRIESILCRRIGVPVRSLQTRCSESNLCPHGRLLESTRLVRLDRKTNVLPSTVKSCFFVAGDAPSWREVGEPTIACLPNRPTSKEINHHDEHQEKHKGSYCALCDRGHAVRCVCPFDIPVIHNNTCYHLSETIISQHQSKSSQHGIRPSRIGIS